MSWLKVVPHDNHRCATPMPTDEGVGSVWKCPACGMRWRMSGRTDFGSKPPLASWVGTPKKWWQR